MAQITVAQVAWQLLWLVASALVARALAPKPPNVEGPRTDNLNVSGSAYGAPIARGWGTVRLGGNVIEGDPIREQRNTQRVGGKGGSSSTVTTFSYFWTGAVAIGRGPISEVLRIWADTKLIYDRTSTSTIVQREGFTIRVYKGSEDQAVDPAIQALHADPTDAIPYRGLAYIVFDDVPLKDFGNRVPQWSFEVAWSSTPVQGALAPTFLGGSLSSYQLPTLLVDWQRDRYFIEDRTGARGIRAFRISNNTEYLQQLESVVYSGDTTLGGGLSAISPDGYLFASRFISGSAVRIHKIDPYTLTTVAERAGPGGFDNILYSVFVTATGVLGAEHYLIYRTLLFDTTLHVLSSANDLTITGTLTVVGRESLKLARGVTTSGNAIAWAVAYDIALSGTTNGLQIHRITQPPRTLGNFGIPSYESPSVALTASVALASIDPTWTRTTDIGAPLYDEADGHLIINVQGAPSPAGGATWRLIKVHSTTGAILWNITTTQLVIYDDQHAYSRVDGRYAATIAADTVLIIDTITGTTTTEVFTLPGSFTGAEIYDSRRDAIITTVSGAGTYLITFGRAGAAPVPLSTIVEDICIEAGFSAPDFYVSQLSGDSVRGYVLNSQSPGRSALEPLALAFDFDGVESDDQLRFIKRGSASVVTIPQDDLVIEEQADALKETRIQEVDLPERVSILYLDHEKDYQQGTQQSKRIALPTPSMFSRNEVSETMPIVFEAEEAKRIADKQLFTAWVEREQQSFQLSQRYLKYDPCDVVLITMESGVTYKSRLMQWDVGQNYALDARAISEEPATFSSTLLADGGTGLPPPPLSLVDPTRLFVVDSPLIRDEDSTGGVNSRLYYAGAGDTPAGAWTSAAVYSSSDGAAWDQHDPLLAEVAWGVAVTTLGDTASPFQTDTVNTVTVQMIDGDDQIESVTELQMLNGANPAILLNAATGELELIQYQSATLNVDGTYTLSRLLRGRRGTDTMTGVHAVGSYFLIPAVSTFRATRVGLDQLNIERAYRAVTSGQLFEDGVEVPKVSTGRDLKPYAPVNVRASPSASDIALVWDRRTRMGGALIDGIGEVPLHEDTESYDIDIYDAPGTTVLRTLTAGAESVTYTAAQIAADLGGVPLTLTLAVYQRSAYVGRGFGRRITVEVR